MSVFCILSKRTFHHVWLFVLLLLGDLSSVDYPGTAMACTQSYFSSEQGENVEFVIWGGFLSVTGLLIFMTWRSFSSNPLYHSEEICVLCTTLPVSVHVRTLPSNILTWVQIFVFLTLSQFRCSLFWSGYMINTNRLNDQGSPRVWMRRMEVGGQSTKATLWRVLHCRVDKLHGSITVKREAGIGTLFSHVLALFASGLPVGSEVPTVNAGDYSATHTVSCSRFYFQHPF